MGIKLDIYLKRTGQTLEGWLDANGVTKAEEFLPRCAYIGLSAGAVDSASVAAIFKKRKQDAVPPAPPPVVETPVEPKPKSKKKLGPASIDENSDQSDPS